MKIKIMKIKSNKRKSNKSNKMSMRMSKSKRMRNNFGNLATLLHLNTAPTVPQYEFVLKDNILRRLLIELDPKYRKLLIDYCNPRVIKKYKHLKGFYGQKAWKEMVLKDPFIINPNIWLSQPVVNQNNKLFKYNHAKEMNLDSVRQIMKQWLDTDCERVYFLNVDKYKHMQEIILDSYNSKKLERNRKKIAEENRVYDYLQRGIIIMCINEGNNPYDAHYVCFFKNPKNSNYIGITTYKMGIELI